jgi:hypothetical protein
MNPYFPKNPKIPISPLSFAKTVGLPRKRSGFFDYFGGIFFRILLQTPPVG